MCLSAVTTSSKVASALVWSDLWQLAQPRNVTATLKYVADNMVARRVASILTLFCIWKSSKYAFLLLVAFLVSLIASYRVIAAFFFLYEKCHISSDRLMTFDVDCLSGLNQLMLTDIPIYLLSYLHQTNALCHWLFAMPVCMFVCGTCCACLTNWFTKLVWYVIVAGEWASEKWTPQLPLFWDVWADCGGDNGEHSGHSFHARSTAHIW